MLLDHRLRKCSCIAPPLKVSLEIVVYGFDRLEEDRLPASMHLAFRSKTSDANISFVVSTML